MTLPRSKLVDPSFTPYYHCVSRCVRRAFLCGRDALTGYDFEHRRDWIERRLQFLARIFAIDLCAYAVMSNHYHLVLHIDTARAHGWDDTEVIARYRQLHKVPENFEHADAATTAAALARWRERLGSISWFMKCVNEPLARLANQEDGCKGRFWEGRFKSQALLDEEAVLKCMAYVDLNPIRSRMANTPEDSDYTSIQARIKNRADALAAMDGRKRALFTLPISLRDYVELVDYTGRKLRRGKRGRIAAALPPVMERLGLAARRDWLNDMSHLTRRYCRAIGSLMSLREYRDFLGQERLNGATG